MIGLNRLKVDLIRNQKLWVIQYEEEKEYLVKLAKDLVKDVQHVGSTSINAIEAKPIIDMAVGLWSFSDIIRVKDLLILAGYHYRPDAGNVDRLFFAKGPEEKRTHYIHVVEFGSKAWKDLIYFRDRLNRDTTLAKKYEALKQVQAQLYPNDRKKYTEGKATFIKNVIEMETKDREKSTLT